MFAYLSKKVSELSGFKLALDFNAKQFIIERRWLEPGKGISRRWW
jgi:hypothetical protein